MKRRISDGNRPGSSSMPPRLRPQSAADGGLIAGASPAPEDGRRDTKEGGDVGEAGFPVENDYSPEGNGGRVEEIEGYLEESDEGDDDEDYVADEPEPELEQDTAAPAAEEDRPKLDDGLFEIEAIRKKRVIKGEPQYLIKWRGWPESSNTWEPMEHLETCPEVVENFETSLNSGKKTRGRKRKYTHSKKLQKSNANNSSRDGMSSRVENRALESGPSHDTSCTSGSKEIAGNADGTSSRVERRALESGPSHGPSCASGSKDIAGNDISVDKENVQMDLTIRLEEAANDDTSPVNSSSRIDTGSTEANQGERRVGAKRRKSANVQRFRPDQPSSDPRLARNFVLANGMHSRAQDQTADNVDAHPTIRFDLSRDNATITRIIKATGLTSPKTNDVQDISLTFLVMRSDGSEMMVDNKFLKTNYPLMLIEFYEKHLRYTPT